ncbi:MAG: zinc-dependent metalloprotease [Rikenellaceae bacterium]|nr:zinc-dependent metalloprotease [Rikenellaceae bacterium]MCL2693082.1 zinc-dependent metalloprotease [Rikenellaceae bacterium]
MRQSIILLLVSCSMLCWQTGAASRMGSGFARATEADTTAQKNTYETLLKDKHTTTEGMITMHDVKGKLYFEFPIALLDREMLIGSTVTEISGNTHAVIGSKQLQPLLHVKFTRIGEYVQLRKISGDYTTDSLERNIVNAIEASNIGAIMRNMKIETYSPDSTAVVINMTDFFVDENKDLTPFDPYSLLTSSGYNRTTRFVKNNSFLGKIKSFDDNVTIQSHLSYVYDLMLGTTMVAKDVPFTAVVTRSIVLLDDQPGYRPRVGDYRMAIFPTGKYFFSEKDQGSREVYYSNRWNLEPSDPEAYLRGEKVEPRKPIVFYVDSNFPDKWKPHIHEGVEQWNELFETIGFKNAIIARDFPADDPEFDPDNIKYSCIRYAPINIANAMGPSWTDPRSGEIINASVYIYHDIVELLNRWIFVQTSQADHRVRTRNIPEDIIGDGLRYVTAHEIGHCLGYMHNMSSSAVIPVDSLRSPTFTQKYGTTMSIMDYARFNYVAQPGDFERGVKLTPPRFGPYDAFAVKWLYTAFPDKTYDEETEILSRWIRESSADPVYRYGKQQGFVLDPRSQAEDLGDDAMKASAYGIANLKYIMENFSRWVDADDHDFTYRQSIYNALINQYAMYIGHVYANIGGVYIQEMKEGDVGEKYQSVPKEIQREALAFILNQLSDMEWMENRELRQKLDFQGSMKDLVEGYVIGLILGNPERMSADVAQKVRFSATLADDPYTFTDCADDVYAFVWKSTMRGKKPTELEMRMQKAYVASYLTGSKLTTAPGFNTRYFAESDFREFLPGARNAEFTESEYVSAYGTSVSPKLFRLRPNESEYYGYLVKLRPLLKRAVRRSSGETRSHYELMLLNIENSIK